MPVQRNPAFRGRALFRNVARQYEKGGFRPDQSHEKSVRHLVRPQRTDAGDNILLAPVCPGKRKDRLELRRGSVVPYSGYGSCEKLYAELPDQRRKQHFARDENGGNIGITERLHAVAHRVHLCRLVQRFVADKAGDVGDAEFQHDSLCQMAGK